MYNSSSWNYSKGSMSFNIFITSMVCVIFIPILIGNGLTLMAYIKFKNLRSNTTLLISSMALTDIRLGIVYVIINLYIFLLVDPPSRLVCHIIVDSQFAVALTSLLHLLALNCERYIHIAFPFFYTRCFTKNVTWILITSIYFIIVVSVIIVHFFMLPQLLLSPWCTAVPISKTKAVFIPIIWFGLPLIFIASICGAIYRIVSKHLEVISEQQRGVIESEGNRREPTKTNKKAIQTIATIIISFGFTWSPYKIALAVAPFLQEESHEHVILYVIPVTLLLQMLNSALNPLIYGLLYPRYRQSYKTIFKDNFCTKTYPSWVRENVITF